MKWAKKGLIYAPSGELWWAKTGAHLPTAAILGNEVIRVFFGVKDANGYGRIGFIDLDAAEPQKILDVAQEPVVDLGEIGAFDDCGAVPNSIIAFNNQSYLYYQGFQQSVRVPYLTFTGLAIGDLNSNRFKKYARTPITDRTDEEPFIRSTSSVLVADGELKMWYVSAPKWIEDEHGVHYICVIRYATSNDGINWKAHKHICLEPVLPNEYAVGRPSIIRDGGIYKMWFSIRSFSKFYTIGFAESEDGIVWERMDAKAGIEKSDAGWDSEMICYPYVVDVNGRKLMFYNGNGRGLSGFGYAVLEN
jgi:predicted GH43/DUF377 family glycosyl hydrolase